MSEKSIYEFINHLEFLGYRCSAEKFDDGNTFYYCFHNTKQDFIIYQRENQSIILKAIYKKELFPRTFNRIELLEYCNIFNSSAQAVNCYVNDDNDIFIQKRISAEYSKVEFGRSIDLFLLSIPVVLDIMNQYSESTLQQNNIITADHSDEEYHCEMNDYPECDHCYDCSDCWDDFDGPDCEDWEYEGEHGPSDSPCYHDDDFG